jgi:carbon monoxide dehydrogenase subunit G
VARVEQSVVVERPAEEVFAYLTDPARIGEWQSSVVSARLDGEGPMRVGARVIETRRLLGKRIDARMEVVEHDPPRRFTIEAVSGPVPFRVRSVLAEVDGGTRLEAVVEGEPGTFFRLAEPLVVRAVERELRGNLQMFKDRLERDG